MKSLGRNAAGDTIVEVLIAVAIVSMVLAGAFTVVGRSSQNARQTEEHNEVLKSLEGQLEQVKSLSKNPATSNAVFTAASAFCVSGNALVPLAPAAGTLPAPYASYPAACKFTSADGGYSYYVGIVRNGNTFTANAVWDGARGTKDNVNLIYKLYP